MNEAFRRRVSDTGVHTHVVRRFPFRQRLFELIPPSGRNNDPVSLGIWSALRFAARSAPRFRRAAIVFDPQPRRVNVYVPFRACRPINFEFRRLDDAPHSFAVATRRALERWLTSQAETCAICGASNSACLNPLCPMVIRSDAYARENWRAPLALVLGQPARDMYLAVQQRDGIGLDARDSTRLPRQIPAQIPARAQRLLACIGSTP
uniref:Uncharacterized protein n=1 Tax=Mycena chlorophos TaxID=658473 RepID=A0ABQ0L771_MYCCL|nr:predicted protein [Mycena chlorophos]